MKETRLMALIDAAGYDAHPYSNDRRRVYGCVSLTAYISYSEIIADLIEVCDDTEEAASLVRQAEQDSIGNGIIVYWPLVEWPEDGRT